MTEDASEISPIPVLDTQLRCAFNNRVVTEETKPGLTRESTDAFKMAIAAVKLQQRLNPNEPPSLDFRLWEPRESEVVADSPEDYQRLINLADELLSDQAGWEFGEMKKQAKNFLEHEIAHAAKLSQFIDKDSIRFGLRFIEVKNTGEIGYVPFTVILGRISLSDYLKAVINPDDLSQADKMVYDSLI